MIVSFWRVDIKDFVNTLLFISCVYSEKKNLTQTHANSTINQPFDIVIIPLRFLSVWISHPSKVHFERDLGANVATRSLCWFGHTKRKYHSICYATSPEVEHRVKSHIFRINKYIIEIFIFKNCTLTFSFGPDLCIYSTIIPWMVRCPWFFTHSNCILNRLFNCVNTNYKYRLFF